MSLYIQKQLQEYQFPQMGMFVHISVIRFKLHLNVMMQFYATIPSHLGYEMTLFPRTAMLCMLPSC